jgi:hypothetical protein
MTSIHLAQLVHVVGGLDRQAASQPSNLGEIATRPLPQAASQPSSLGQIATRPLPQAASQPNLDWLNWRFNK